jgi:hypothetical protein
MSTKENNTIEDNITLKKTTPKHHLNRHQH